MNKDLFKGMLLGVLIGKMIPVMAYQSWDKITELTVNDLRVEMEEVLESCQVLENGTISCLQLYKG